MLLASTITQLAPTDSFSAELEDASAHAKKLSSVHIHTNDDVGIAQMR